MAKAASDFVRVSSTAEIPEGKMKKVTAGSQQVLVANVKGKFYAIGNVCTHFGGSLDRGILEGNEVECPLHHSHFDVTTGQVKRGPASRPEPVYDVKIESGSILVRPKQYLTKSTIARLRLFCATAGAKNCDTRELGAAFRTEF